MTAEAVATIVATAVDAKLKAFENGLFANARKAGLLKKEEPAPATPTAASTALSMDDVKAMIARENAIARIATEHKLKPEAEKRLRDAVEFAKPDDALGYCTSFVTDLGLVRTTPDPSTTVTAPNVPVVPNAAPISDRGSPAPNGAVGWKFEMTNPIGMSTAARAQMDAELGPEKARKMRLEAAKAQAEGMRVTINPRG